MDITAVPGFSEPFSSITHLAAAVGFFIATGFLLKRGRGNALRLSALLLYSFGVIYLFSMSGVYHLLDPDSTARHVFQRLDHSAIWFMIAGTFTPIHIILFRGFWRWGLLTLIWTTAITGLVLETVFFRDFPEALSLSFYLGLGWVGLFSCHKYMKHYDKRSAVDMAMGGITYSIGAILEFTRWPVLIPGIIGPHEIFHVFVLAAAVFHWRFIYSLADMAITKRLTLLIKVRGLNHYFITAVSENIRFKARSKDEILLLLRAEIHRAYRDYTRPKAIRLQYFHEEFIDPTSETAIEVAPDVFHS